MKHWLYIIGAVVVGYIIYAEWIKTGALSSFFSGASSSSSMVGGS